MQVIHERNLEALIFSDDKHIAACCAEAFAELPVDWVKTEDSGMARQLLSNSRFDFVVVDLDAPSGTTLLPRVRPDCRDRHHGVVLAITSGGIDADILEMSYESLIFYPVRPEQIIGEVHRALPLAERISSRPTRASLANDITIDTDFNLKVAEASAAHTIRIPHFGTLVSTLWERAMQHSLSIVAQEWAASLISAAGTIWYVHEITHDWTQLAFLVPSPGPTQLIGIAVLLWLCAKHRRYLEKSSLVPAEIEVNK